MSFDFNKIKSDFAKVVSYSQGIEGPRVDKLFADWLEAKRDYIEAWDGELIYEWPEKVSFELGTKEKNLRIKDFLELVELKYTNADLADFISEQKDGFFSNMVTKEYLYNGIKIPKGMKLIKSFKYFESDPIALNAIQSAASMIIQEDKVDGILCLSVHPLDFLSLSENNHNWRSCHALDGEFRAGNLSYMVDNTTFICYLKSEKNERLVSFPGDVLWNSKKWRVLLYLSERWDMLFAGRQYPFFTDTGLNFVKNKVLPAARLGSWSDWLSKKVNSVTDGDYHFSFTFPYLPVNKKLIPLNEIVINGEGALQFNDVLSSSCYDPVYAYKETAAPWAGFSGKPKIMRVSNHPKMIVGGGCNCLKCESERIQSSESFMCDDCELLYGTVENEVIGSCPSCGARFFIDNGYWVEDAQETICEVCAENETEICENCGERFYRDSMVYSRDNHLSLCRWCYEDTVIADDNEEEEFIRKNI